MDQVRITHKQDSKGNTLVYADPLTRGYHDLLVKGGAFYAVFDKHTNLWSQELARLSELIDDDIRDEANRIENSNEPHGPVVPMYMVNMSNGYWTRYCNTLHYLDDSKIALNQRMIFANDTPKREDYATQKLDYSVLQGDISSYDKLMGTIYSKEEREKLEWGIGALVDGRDIKRIQKMFVIYGDPGTGKSTVLEIIRQLFGPYCAQFNAEDLGKGYQFATAAFKNSPLVGIQMDGDLSHMWDNTLLNQISAHEDIIINEKGVKQYTIPLKTMLFMATNKPVRITDSKSGIVRRLIDIYPTGNTLPPDEYFACMDHIRFELGAIAYHCREVYRKLGMNRYSKYSPTGMIARTNDIYAFVQDNIDLMDSDDISLSDLWRAYKEWADESNVDVRMKRSEFSYEIGTYFESVNRKKGKAVTYHGFRSDKFQSIRQEPQRITGSNESKYSWLKLGDQQSRFDDLAAEYNAQYARNDDSGAPQVAWSKNTTKLKELDTHKLHWVMVPENHIVLDFDLRGPNGEKSLEENLKAAEQFPPTYAEVSKSGNGLHLHYIYDGDVSKLKNLYSLHIEVKVFKGNSSLRRKLSQCNDLPVTHISSGLPLKKEKTVINDHELKDEKHLRSIINNCLMKKYLPGTKPSIDFIKKLTDEMYESGKPYDISDLKNDILNFAMNSTHWSDYCVGVVANMKFKSEDPHESKNGDIPDVLTFYDVEVFPNLFMICFMKSDSNIVKTWINPPRSNVMTLLDENLVGFNNRKYDNHMLWAWGVVGYDNAQLYHLSQKIVSGDNSGMFSQAYNVSYADIYDFAAKKQSLKKWEIELGIDHHELGMPWDQPVPRDKWPLVQSYCEDDVRATKAVFEHLKEDFTARIMLSRLSGLSVNDTTNTHTAKIIFGNNKHPQNEFNFTDLSKTFPGYTFNRYAPKDEKSRYLGENPSEGGYVFVYGMKDGTYGYDYMHMKHPWEEGYERHSVFDSAQ